MLRPKEACQRLGISYATLREYVKKGYIKPVILQSGKWRFREEDVEKLMGIVKRRKVVLYARVSSSTQKDDLVNQVKYLEEQVKEYDQVITDIGSGLNMKRKGFLKLLRMILNNEVSRVVIAYPDRLVRFGFEILEEVCKSHNCEIVVINQEDKTPEEELVEDLVSILVLFSGKLYGMRSHEYEKVKKCVEELKA
ncbi:IS607 family transposase [Saccharolobus solfataricus]|uniref:Orf in partial transposon ISC1904 n=3 Tax=Saccharolobus solfataricus TaxID=2287 RepID=Q97XI0_SACS2|nr:IS607 family transposase [Saccharolobus solfataricus]AAK41954.1 Orf in partial transposon ISC1904 [Saccharolobus solfataricus P2]AKA74701.1 IS607 family transposase [Saccharolobus solfataricus]AKA77395.1 IS607 family transposase [Saccharolobus solfataricus]AKA80086.1 IS607 family transposase [Saccharolobus solfataricus]AZF69165.1 IS607 family transposase [Saccharolobus solfataricus]